MSLSPDLEREHPPLALRLLARAYRAAVIMRARLYRRGVFKSGRLPVRVISVGNLTVGGTGKTPAVALIVKMLQSRGFSPAILTRGYKGTGNDPVGLVADGQKIHMGPDQAGDEAFLLAGLLPGVPVLKGRNRLLLGRQAIDRFKADYLVLDDGFQHLALDRDLDLLLLDAQKPWGNGYLLPAGSLREPPRAAARANAFVLTRAAGPCLDVQKELQARFPHCPVFTARHRPTLVRSLDGRLQDRPDCLSGLPITAVCGLARPGVFLQTLGDLGAGVKEFIKWPDHFQPGARDWDRVISAAVAADTRVIVTTAKDAVKLAGRFDALFSRKGLRVWVLEVEMEILDKQRAFWELIAPGARD